MTPARHAELRRLLAAALRWVPAERPAVIAALAGDDRALADEVVDLLGHVDDEPAPAPTRDARALPVEGQPLVSVVAAVDAAWPLPRVLAALAPLAAVEVVHDEDDADGPWTRAEAALCAPEELAPELGPRGPWTTVYVLAAAAVALLRGPAPAPEAAAIVARVGADDAQPTPRALGVALPPAVDAVLTRALARRPLERIQTVPRLLAQLEAAAASAAATSSLVATSSPVASSTRASSSSPVASSPPLRASSSSSVASASSPVASSSVSTRWRPAALAAVALVLVLAALLIALATR